MVVMFGMILGPVVAGVLADHTGSYVPGVSVLAGLSAPRLARLPARAPPALALAQGVVGPPTKNVVGSTPASFT